MHQINNMLLFLLCFFIKIAQNILAHTCRLFLMWLVCVLLALVSQTYSTDIYVAFTGDDQNTGGVSDEVTAFIFFLTPLEQEKIFF